MLYDLCQADDAAEIDSAGINEQIDAQGQQDTACSQFAVLLESFTHIHFFFNRLIISLSYSRR